MTPEKGGSSSPQPRPTPDPIEVMRRRAQLLDRLPALTSSPTTEASQQPDLFHAARELLDECDLALYEIRHMGIPYAEMRQTIAELLSRRRPPLAVLLQAARLAPIDRGSLEKRAIAEELVAAARAAVWAVWEHLLWPYIIGPLRGAVPLPPEAPSALQQRPPSLQAARDDLKVLAPGLLPLLPLVAEFLLEFVAGKVQPPATSSTPPPTLSAVGVIDSLARISDPTNRDTPPSHDLPAPRDIEHLPPQQLQAFLNQLTETIVPPGDPANVDAWEDSLSAALQREEPPILTLVALWFAVRNGSITADPLPREVLLEVVGNRVVGEFQTAIDILVKSVATSFFSEEGVVHYFRTRPEWGPRGAQALAAFLSGDPHWQKTIAVMSDNTFPPLPNDPQTLQNMIALLRQASRPEGGEEPPSDPPRP